MKRGHEAFVAKHVVDVGGALGLEFDRTVGPVGHIHRHKPAHDICRDAISNDIRPNYEP